MLAILERFGKLLPIRFQQLKGKRIGNFLDHPGLGKILESAQHDRVPFPTKINAQIRIAPDRQLIESSRERLGDGVMVLDRIKRDRYATIQAQFAGPHPPGQHDVLRFDWPLLRLHACGPSISVPNF